MKIEFLKICWFSGKWYFENFEFRENGDFSGKNGILNVNFVKSRCPKEANLVNSSTF